MCAVYLLSLLLAVPELTPDQREQLQTASDGSPRIDEPAFYPLLQNALTWTPGDEAGARIADYDALLRDPASQRGELFLIEGKMGGPARAMQALSRPIHLDKPGEPMRVQQWGVLVRSNPDLVAVVYLADPPPLEQSLRAGRPVRLVGRFYKVWQASDHAGQSTLYPVFVGRTVVVSGGGSATVDVKQMLFITVVLAGLLILTLRKAMKMNLKPRPLPSRMTRVHEQRAQRGQAEQLPDLPGPPLPQDPAEALNELERRRRDADAADH